MYHVDVFFIAWCCGLRSGSGDLCVPAFRISCAGCSTGHCTRLPHAPENVKHDRPWYQQQLNLTVGGDAVNAC